MPNYDYECKKCGYEFEKFQYMNEEPIRKCPKCNTNNAKRLIGAGAGIIFKGSGFYATDYRKGKLSEKPQTCPITKEGKPDCSSCKSK